MAVQTLAPRSETHAALPPCKRISLGLQTNNLPGKLIDRGENILASTVNEQLDACTRQELIGTSTLLLGNGSRDISVAPF